MKTSILSLDQGSAALRAHADAAVTSLRADAPDLYEALHGTHAVSLRGVAAASDFVFGVMRRQSPALLDALVAGRFDAPDAPRLTPLPKTGAEDDVRRQRDREMALIAWHDLVGARDTVETLQSLSDLGDLLIQAACERALAADAVRNKGELAPPLVLGMGKLGGRELNFSSDVDLIFVHPDGDAERRYLRVARDIVQFLDARTAAGRVHRVDVRLRPFGRTGALSLSVSAFERYLQTHARDWERYAYVKARVLTGLDSDRASVEQVIRSFVYRRYLDYGVFDALRETKSLIESEVARHAQDDDLKRGSGGIREIEFIAQAVQILRGGQHRDLQTTSLRGAFLHIAALDLPDATNVDELLAAYDVLRHVENRLQMLADQQTHALPTDALMRERIAAAAGYTVPQLEHELGVHRAMVRATFADVVDEGDTGKEARSGHALWRAAGDEKKVLAALASTDVESDTGFQASLHSLATSRPLARLDKASRDRLDRLVPTLIESALKTPRPGRTLSRLTKILEGVGRRSAYFALLIERPQARDRLVSLCARSRRITEDVADFPLLLDSLIGLDVTALPDTRARGRQLVALLRDIDWSDLDHMTDAIARFKTTAQFEVAVADLTSQLDVMKVSDHLTEIAQSVLHALLDAALADVVRRYGRLPNENQFCVVAYGKLGGIELGYGSDLDLVFLYDAPDAGAVSDGKRSLDAPQYFARLVQRVVGLVTATTRAGALYEVDMRLRPSGNSGPLVSRLSAYATYQRERAWTWEHQALLRARIVASDTDLAERFRELRRDVLCQPRDHAALREQVASMRRRMRVANPAQADAFHVKHDPGGLTDVEFIVQYALLAGADRNPQLVRFSDHIRHLDALIAARQLGSDVGEDLKSIYLAYRTHLHRRALDDGDVRVRDGRFASERARVRALWDTLIE